MNRKELSTYICAGVFILLTVFKLAFPGTALAAADRLSEMVDTDDDIKQAMLMCSELISQSDEAITEAFSPSEAEPPRTEVSEVDAVTVQTEVKPHMVERYYTLRNVVLTNISSEDTAEEAAQTEEEYAAAVETFKRSQESYSYLELPENVSYEYKKLGMDCSSPVAGTSSSGFGYRLHPIQGVVKFHYGTDFSANQSEGITAFAAGVVTTAQYSDSYGYYVVIEHENNCKTLYAHCSELLVSAGESVSVGQTIALVGATGLATGPHLHFELTCDGVYLNPEYYVNVGEVL